MKKLMCVLLVVVMMLSLVACGNTLKGTYKSDEKLGSYVQYTFNGDKVTVVTTFFIIQSPFSSIDNNRSRCPPPRCNQADGYALLCQTAR